MSRLPSRWENDLKGIHCLMIKKTCLYPFVQIFFDVTFFNSQILFILNVYLEVDYSDLRVSHGVLNYSTYVIYQFKQELKQINIFKSRLWWIQIFHRLKIKAENIVLLLHNKENVQYIIKLTTNSLISCWLNIGAIYWN